MKMSNKLTIFAICLFLLAALVAMPVMASGVEVMYTTVADPAAGATATAGANWVVTFTFTEGGSFVKNDFITPGDPKTINVSLAGNAVAESAFSYADKKLTVPIPASATTALPTLAFTVTGYQPVTDAAAATAATALAPVDGSLRGKGYLVVVKDGTADNLPRLPASVTVGTPVALDGATAGTTGDEVAVWADMPNLEEFFNVGGGTIDLKVANTAKDSRRLVINEVMWAVDNAKVGEGAYTQQQWIEIYNPSSIPILHTAITLSTIPNTGGLNPPAEIAAGTADRLSNIPSLTHTWNVKGSSGTSISNDATPPVIVGANPMFKSMYRNDIRGGWEGAGSNSSNWSDSTLLYLPGFVGTPGGANTRGGVPGARSVAAATNPPKDKIIVNEIGLSDDEDGIYDWIELYNVSDSAVNLKKWTISLTTGYGNEDVIYRFRDNDNFPNGHHSQIIPAKGYLLLVFADPEGSPLAVGIDVLKMGPVADGEPGDQKLGHSDHKYLNVNDPEAATENAKGATGNAAKGLPDNTDWLIIIRSNHEDKYLQSSHHIQDVAGPGGGSPTADKFVIQDISKTTVRRNKKGNGDAGGDIWHTKIWPLQNQNGKDVDTFLRHTAKDKNDGGKINLDAGSKVWYRRLDKGGGQGWRKEAFGNAPYTGVGYDRDYKGQAYRGTPGYPNNISKGKVGDIAEGKVVISELMLTTDDGRFPQWLELHNTSKISAVNLEADDGWRLVIENHDSGQWDGKRDTVATINFKGSDVKSIPPNQTVLVTSITTRTNSKNEFYPDNRVYSVYENDRKVFFMANRRSPFLNTNGFHIKLIDGKKTVSDEIGNLDGNNRTYDSPYSWEWPTDMTEDGKRTSLVRLKDADKMHRMGTPDRTVDNDKTGQVLPIGWKYRGNGMVGMGMDAEGNSIKVPAKYAGAAWVHASDVRFQKTDTYYYGSRDDIGTPAHTSNTPLPVELSHFRPTLENGEVVIRWTTESELNNAGFNIYRSDTRDGEYKQVNSELIDGAGTTGERNTYKWIDPSAKPNVVYYYQIEDVSFAGERQTLQTTKLKGLISARGKATTTWGELKEVQ